MAAPRACWVAAIGHRAVVCDSRLPTRPRRTPYLVDDPRNGRTRSDARHNRHVLRSGEAASVGQLDVRWLHRDLEMGVLKGGVCERADVAAKRRTDLALERGARERS